MKISEKIKFLKSIPSSDELQEDFIRAAIYRCALLKKNYVDYMTTRPINCNLELLRLPSADYDLCCALLTMLLREDHFCNGTFSERIQNGDVKRVIDRLISITEGMDSAYITSFSEKALAAINGYYVYALIDPRSNEVFYIGKGTGNRIFSHEAESEKSPKSEKPSNPELEYE